MSNISVKGTFYDGQASGRHASELVVDENNQVSIHGVVFPSCALNDIVIPSRLGNTSRLLQLPNGAMFETSDNDNLDRIAALIKNSNPLLNPHFWESKLVFALLALVLLVGFTYFAVEKGIPVASNAIAKSLPDEVSTTLAEGVLAKLDDVYLKPTKLSQQQQQHYRNLFNQLLPQQEDFPFRLNFRSSEIMGANAFALPNGDIVVTDDLIELAENDEEVMAVLYHEVGHVVEHHSLRQLLAATGTSILFAWILEDVEGVANLLLTAPILLIQTAYSRDHETEADTYALNGLLAADMDPIHFSNIMNRLSNPIVVGREGKSKKSEEDESANQQDSKKELPTESKTNKTKKGESWWRYLSTHPASEDRVKRFRIASEQWRQQTQ